MNLIATRLRHSFHHYRQPIGTQSFLGAKLIPRNIQVVAGLFVWLILSLDVDDRMTKIIRVFLVGGSVWRRRMAEVAVRKATGRLMVAIRSL